MAGSVGSHPYDVACRVGRRLSSCQAGQDDMTGMINLIADVQLSFAEVGGPI